jgi:sarcosine oxidase
VSALLRDLQLPLTIERKVLTWIEPRDPRMFAPEVFPVFTMADDFFYGFPNISNEGVKLAIHWRREQVIDDPFAPVRPASDEDFGPVVRMANRYLPALTDPLPDGLSRVRRGATCLYTMTPDEHFIVDRHPERENVWFAAGFSGHGFKFAPAIGEALADLCTEGKTALPIEFLRIGKRFVA